MAEYSPSKIIKDGNTYNFRDTTKIPLAGSNQISGSLIPSTDGTVNLGSSSKKFASLNGIAPDELGLPTSTYTDVSSYITNLDNTANTFTAPASGLLNIATGGDVIRVVDTTTGVSAVSAPAFSTCILFMPVCQGDSLEVYIAAPLVWGARIYHLKGKV